MQGKAHELFPDCMQGKAARRGLNTLFRKPLETALWAGKRMENDDLHSASLTGAQIPLSSRPPKPKPKAAHKIAPAPPPIPEEVVDNNEQLFAWDDTDMDNLTAYKLEASKPTKANWMPSGAFTKPSSHLERTAAMLGLSRSMSRTSSAPVLQRPSTAPAKPSSRKVPKHRSPPRLSTTLDQDDEIESRYRRALASKLAEGYMLSAAELAALRAETVLPMSTDSVGRVGASAQSVPAASGLPLHVASSETLETVRPPAARAAPSRFGRPMDSKPAKGAAASAGGDEDESIYAMLAEKVTVEGSLREELATARVELARVREELTTQLERARLELETHKGRMVATKVAGEEAHLRGVPWSHVDARRLYAAARAPPSRGAFASPELAEVMAQALPATSRRVAEALSSAASVRAESEKADAESKAALELDFAAMVQTGTAEHQARLTTRAMMARSHRTTTKLRAALLHLEEEATVAQSCHAADVRRLAARLSAEREMMLVVFAEALASSESDETAGSLSVSRLLEQLRAEYDERAHETRVHGAEMLQLHRALAISQDELRRERHERYRERTEFECTAGGRNSCLARELPPLERALARALAERAVDVATLRSELRHEEAQRWDELGALTKQLEDAQQQTKVQAQWYESKLKQLRTESGEKESLFKRRMQADYEEKVALEARLESQIRKLETDRQLESKMYIRRVEKLSTDIEQLRCDSTSGRRKAYFRKIKEGLVALGGGRTKDETTKDETTKDGGVAHGVASRSRSESPTSRAPTSRADETTSRGGSRLSSNGGRSAEDDDAYVEVTALHDLVAKLAEGKLLRAQELAALRGLAGSRGANKD